VSNPDTPFFVTGSPTRTFGTTDEITLQFEFKADTEPDTEWVLTIAAGALDVGAGGDPNGELTAQLGH
jgi:hypothetical protein